MTYIPVSSKHQPWCCRAVDSLKVVIQPLILRRRCPKVMLCAHDNKVDVAIVKAIPEGESIAREEAQSCTQDTPTMAGREPV